MGIDKSGQTPANNGFLGSLKNRVTGVVGAAEQGVVSMGRDVANFTSRATGQSSQPNGVKQGILPSLPGPVRFVMAEAATAVGAGQRAIQGMVGANKAPQAPANANDPLARARYTLQAANQQLSTPQTGVYRQSASGAFKMADVWPLGQGLAGAIDTAKLTSDWSQVNSMMAGLANYKQDGAYAPGIWSTKGSSKMYDDNAWIGLDFMQAYTMTGNKDYLNHAQDLFNFIQKGLSPQGGLYWQEKDKVMSRNTCANGPAIEYALRLYQATGDKKYLDTAKNMQQFMDSKLRGPDGLYYDNLGDDGKLSKDYWTYNQGVAIGADVQWYKLTKDPKYLKDAQQTAKAALDYFGQQDRMWKSPPVFNAIFYRNLMALDAVAPDPSYRKSLDDYANRLWTQARDPKTGLFDQNGVGAYDKGGSFIDQGGVAQIFALQAMPKDQIPNIS